MGMVLELLDELSKTTGEGGVRHQLKSVGVRKWMDS
jgi:hypothetical protein